MLPFQMLNQEQLQRLLKSWRKSMLSDKPALPQSPANPATHYFQSLWKSSVQKHTLDITVVWNWTNLRLSFEHVHFQTHQPKQRYKKVAAGRFVRNTRGFPKETNSRPTRWHFIIRSVPQLPVRTCQCSKQGELGSGKKYKSAHSLTYNQHRHSKMLFFPKVNLTNILQTASCSLIFHG